MAWLLLACLLAPASLPARDAFVMLSGGVSPWANNYSQYLQARAVVTWLEQNYPRDSVWAFFGAGNVEGREPIFCDVRRLELRGSRGEETWLPGFISRNRPAQRDLFLQALRDEILPAVADGGTLYLFVGDHGSQSRGTNSESIIDMWTILSDPGSDRGWRSTRDAALKVSDLREAITRGIGKGRVVFCMTQCHSGGFHHLAVPRVQAANPKWFTTPPAWLSNVPPAIEYAPAAGFTATDERSLAAGCQPDPDYLKWIGYERYVPEKLFGWDLFELKPTVKGLSSFAEAHEAATLIDQTIDKPFSTSELYLERWAGLIEARLLRETNNLTPRVKRALAAYQRTVDGAIPREVDLPFRQRQAQFRHFTERMGEQNPSARKLLLTGTRKELETAIGMNRRPGGTTTRTNSTQSATNRTPSRLTGTQTNTTRAATNAVSSSKTNAPTDTQKQWKVIRPVWAEAVEKGDAQKVVGRAVEFERFLLSQEAKGMDNFSSTSRARVAEEAFYRSGYTKPRELDQQVARAVLDWAGTRRSNITAWAKGSTNDAVREAAEKLLARSTSTNAPTTNRVANLSTNRPPAAPGRITQRIAAERVLFYRRTLAAWEFLLAVNERPALARVRELTHLERTPLPRPRKK